MRGERKVGWGEESKAILFVTGPPLSLANVCNKMEKNIKLTTDTQITQRRNLEMEKCLKTVWGTRWDPKSMC